MYRHVCMHVWRNLSIDCYLCITKIHTFFLSLIEPFPLTIILQPVSCSNCLAVIPRGPRILPTKLNCNKQKKTDEEISKIKPKMLNMFV